MPRKVNLFSKLIGLILLVFVAACSNNIVRPAQEHPVYPPPPDKARFIFEASLRSSDNISQPTFSDKLQEVATGTREVATGLAKPYGVAAYKGRVYVTDTQQRAIVVFDLNKRKVQFIGDKGEGKLLKPLGITICKNKEIFVADITAKRIQVFDLNGKYLRTFGNKNEFNRPVGIACDPLSDNVYVVDAGGVESDMHHLLVYNGKTGELLKTIGHRGKGKDAFNIPLQIATTKKGKIYVVDSGNFRIQTLSPQGKFLGSFGSIGRQAGQFSRPKGIATDKDGNIYVVDTAFGNVQIFNPQHQLLMVIGERTTSGGPGKFSLPAGIAIDETGRIYVVDQFFRKVDIFRPVNVKPFPVFEE